MHLPKTAGFSFWHGFRNLFGAQNVTDHLADFYIGLRDAARFDQCRMISGHISYRDAAYWFPERAMMTVLREPIDRAISQYFFLRTLGNPQDPTASLARAHGIEAYFKLPTQTLCQTVSNRMTRQLGAHCLDMHASLKTAFKRAKETLHRCHWVGIYESLPGYLQQLQTEPDFHDFVLPRERVTPNRLAVKEIPEELRARIVELNQYDLEIYSWAAAEFRMA